MRRKRQKKKTHLANFYPIKQATTPHRTFEFLQIKQRHKRNKNNYPKCKTASNRAIQRIRQKHLITRVQTPETYTFSWIRRISIQVRRGLHIANSSRKQPQEIPFFYQESGEINPPPALSPFKPLKLHYSSQTPSHRILQSTSRNEIYSWKERETALPLHLYIQYCPC